MQDIRTQVRKLKKDIADGTFKPSESTRATVFTEILNSNMPEPEKETERLSREAQVMVQAGIETVSWSTFFFFTLNRTCSPTVHLPMAHAPKLTTSAPPPGQTGITTNLTYLLSNPRALARLRAELFEAIPPTPDSSPADLPSWATLEQLPYLSACVLEGLRLGYGVVTRLARIAETETLVLTDDEPQSPHRGKTWSIPPGTPVGMSAYHVHHDERVFVNSREYWPERWLDEDGKRDRRLEGYLLSFSKGSRQCVGMNLAQAELYLGLAMWVRWFGDRLELAEGCGVHDVKYVWFFPSPSFPRILFLFFFFAGESFAW